MRCQPFAKLVSKVPPAPLPQYLGGVHGFTPRRLKWEVPFTERNYTHDEKSSPGEYVCSVHSVLPSSVSVWTHRSTVEALSFTLAWHYLLIEVLRFLVLATEGSVSKLTYHS